LGGFSYRGLGIAAVNLHELATSFEVLTSIEFPLIKCPDGSGSIVASISVKFVGEADPDDNGSIASDSFSVTDAAEFESKTRKVQEITCLLIRIE
jgi:hypothetical protein